MENVTMKLDKNCLISLKFFPSEYTILITSRHINHYSLKQYIHMVGKIKFGKLNEKTKTFEHILKDLIEKQHAILKKKQFMIM